MINEMFEDRLAEQSVTLVSIIIKIILRKKLNLLLWFSPLFSSVHSNSGERIVFKPQESLFAFLLLVQIPHEMVY